MIVRERVLLATPGHRDKDWIPPPTHQQLKNFSHATTKKVLAGEGLRLTSRVLVCFINSKLYKMETTIVTANVRNAETGTRVINLATSEEFEFLDRANAFAHGKRKMLNISMKQFMHFINEANSDIADDVAFTLMATDPTDAQIEDILMGAKVNIEQTERSAGEQYEANGQQVIAVYDSIHISKFDLLSVSAVGRFALDYDGDATTYATCKSRRVAWTATRKSLR